MDPASFDPGMLGEVADPYEPLAALRSAAPVAPVAGGFWAVTGHSAAVEVLKHPGFVTSPIAELYLAGLPAGAARDEMGHRINFLDPPDHPRVRSLVNRAFTPRRVDALRPWAASTAEALLDATDPAAGPVDVLEVLAHQLPSLVISELLGVPPERRDHLTGLSDRVAPLLSVSVTDEERAAAIAAAAEMHAHLGGLVADRRVDPRDDLLSALVTAESDGSTLSTEELLSLAATLYSAGHRTTRDLFCNGLAVLLSEPDRYRRVVDGTWPVPDVVAEMLRFETPTLYVARIAAEPVAIGDVTIPASSPVLVYLSAANRDPAAYDDPDDFLPGRGGPAPLSFAFGAHYCLGASLARSEAEVMLEAVVRRWPRLRLASPDSPIRWHLRGPFRGVDELLVQVDEGPAAAGA